VTSRRHWTLYTGVDVEAVAASASREGPALRKRLGLEGHPVAGVVGRLRHEKGQDILLEAMAQVAARVPEARLLVVGDGPDRDALQAQARRLGLESSVVWAGQAAPEEVHAYYGAMDVLVVPSRFEGFGLVAVEGLAAGLPVVASGVEGLREIVEGLPGEELVPAGDAGALEKAIVDCLQCPKARAEFKPQARAEVTRRFSMEAFAEAHRALVDVKC
jgi:glycosyltransferase involved in cell wall biosynthesis